MRRRTARVFSGALILLLAVAPAHAAGRGKSKRERVVYLAPAGRVYRERGCIALKHLKNPEAVSRDAARRRGRRECYYCFPDKAANKGKR